MIHIALNLIRHAEAVEHFFALVPAGHVLYPEEVGPLFFAVYDDELPLAQMVVGRGFQACVDDPLKGVRSNLPAVEVTDGSPGLIASYTSIFTSMI